MPSTCHIKSKYAPKASQGISLSGKGFIVTAPAALSREEDDKTEMFDLTIKQNNFGPLSRK
jgi:hypothetical protein